MAEEYTDSQKKAIVKYLREKTDDIRLRTPKGTKERWQAAAAERGISMTRYVVDLVEADISRDRGGSEGQSASRSG